LLSYILSLVSFSLSFNISSFFLPLFLFSVHALCV
jgi:hypothetical protein